MSQKVSIPLDEKVELKDTHKRFYTKTVEIQHIQRMAYLKVGQHYKDQQFYWQSANENLSIIGFGHAHIIETEEQETRYERVAKQWKQLTAELQKTEEDVSPVLVGGFSFDPTDTEQSEWKNFPSAHFFVPTFQFVEKNGRQFIVTNFVSEDSDAEEQFARLCQEHQLLIDEVRTFVGSEEVKPIVEAMHEMNVEAYKKAVHHTTLRIQRGEAKKVVIARALNLQFEENIKTTAALEHITSEQPNSYRFGLQNGRQLFFGATPERLVEITDGRVLSACIAGSIKRGQSEEEDQALGDELLNDPKNLEEHQYVVDMIRAVFEANCTEIQIPTRPELLKIRDIQHLHTSVEATLKEGSTIFEFVEALHPTPALGGVPTADALAIIQQEEQINRGYYAGPIGWVDAFGDGEFAVAIRSALVEDDQAYLYAGGGIVADSEVDKEYEETWVKFRPVLRALGGQFNDK